MNPPRHLPAALLLLPLLLATPASAQTVWRWTNDQGEVHYTDDRHSIPDKHRAKAQKTSGNDLGHVSTSEGQATRSEGVYASGDTGFASSDDEDHWRRQFSDARERIQTAEEALANEQRALEESAGGGMPGGLDRNGVPRVNPDHESARARQPGLEAELQQAKEALAQLDRLASRASVPRHWRR